MSKIKEAIETALDNVNRAATATYGAKVYTFDQVAAILQDLLEDLREDESEDAGVTLTREQLDKLYEILQTRIDANISNMSDSDILDDDSIEMSISGARATIENIDIDKDTIIAEAIYGIDDDIYEWAERIGIKPDSAIQINRLFNK